MSDSSSGVGGVGGVGSSGGGGGGGVNGVDGTSSIGTSTGPSAEDVANAMVEAASGPTGVNTDALGAQLAGLQAADPAFGNAVQSAVEAQLSAVDAGRLESAIDAAAAAQPSLVQHLTRIDVPTPPDVTTVNPTYSYNPQGHLVDACGTRVTTAGVPDARQAALEKALAEYDEHAQKVTGGPVSGPAYSAAYALGADEKTRNQVHAFGKIADGAVEHWAQKAEEMHVPLDR